MNSLQVGHIRKFKDDITRFMMTYKFALDAMETKIEILKEEFQFLHDYNPIEHTSSRLKSPESIMKKLYKKGGELSFDGMKEHIKDIAGIRITCSFINDIYRISDMLQSQEDIKFVEVKDYIKNPKKNGYQSLHLLIEIPVYMSDRKEDVSVEIQIRTIAMDFWASLEHKIYYKYNQSIPAHLLIELKEAADSAAALDRQMERLHREVTEIKERRTVEAEEVNAKLIHISNQQFQVPDALLRLLDSGNEEE
ncbi:GTP pyrophosphokinase family protein [Paenibacillus albiflavus]|uniref:GTP pyrophosphokinase family protein n=1 Tax=Paenibacillus albiflavus TaxID=2545760 RepID=A0A4R4EJT4_9BACL|nr:GTP pyrophosphokinase family protein [Paenibacillus albiflavus]TCZ80249.1 GTP pyrophosphokinase family protein [Paenibacillus albiflavus]